MNIRKKNEIWDDSKCVFNEKHEGNQLDFIFFSFMYIALASFFFLSLSLSFSLRNNPSMKYESSSTNKDILSVMVSILIPFTFQHLASCLSNILGHGATIQLKAPHLGALHV